ncbi:transposase [uncultured Desulfovibrio sp.]|uniref:integrase core domain-containing protein n=1 Tax=uncultured Desulfovibrio sp. TaxID=167968 RepID=UPI00343F0B96
MEFSRPGKPTDNEHIESVNGKYRDECLNQNVFLSLHDARRTVEAWRQDTPAMTAQLIGLADTGRVPCKEYNPLETTNLQVRCTVG